MADLSSPFNELLQRSNATPIGTTPYSLDEIDDFLKEAYQINHRVGELLTYLRTIRQPYLSTAPPPRRRQLEQRGSKDALHLTDTDRDQIDAEAKGVLRDLHAAVKNLSRAEEIRRDGDKARAENKKRRHGFGVLGSWAAGGGILSKSPEEQLEEARANGIKACREGVIWFLNRRLEHCGSVQSSMMEIRINREVEKSKSILYKGHGASVVPVWDESEAKGSARGGSQKMGGKTSGVLLEELQGEAANSGMNDEQMQVLAKENQNLIKQYENKLDQVRNTEKSLIEIAELQTTLATNLDIQSAQIDQLVQDSFNTTENVGSGNAQLKKASERKSTAKLVFYATAGVCSFFVLWDFFI